MKKLVLLIIVIAFSFKLTNAQLSTDAPILSQIWSTLIQSQTTQYASLQELIEQKLKEQLKNKAFITKLGTLKKIKDLVEDIQCQLDELNVNLSISYNDNCLTKLNINMALINVQYSTDILKWVVVGSNFLMDQQGQATTLQTIKESLEKSIKMIAAINSSLRTNIQRAVVKSLYEEMYKPEQGNSYSRHY